MADVLGVTKEELNDIREFLRYQARSGSFFEDNYEETPPQTIRPMKGSYGTVKKVISRDTDQEFAVKIIEIKDPTRDSSRQEQRDVERIRQSFIRAILEAGISDRYGLHHPHISKAHTGRNWVVLPDTVTEDFAFELTDFLDGNDSIDLDLLQALIGTKIFLIFDWYPDDLTSFLPTQILDEKQLEQCKTFIQGLLIQVAIALGFIHSKDLVYGDLKPDNILIYVDRVTEEANGAICDFGLTRPLYTGGEPLPITERGNLLFCDDPANYYTPKFDTWSYGHLLCWCKLFIAYRRTVPLAHFNNKFKPLVREQQYDELRVFLYNNLPEEHASVRELIVQCVQKDVQDRPDVALISKVMEQDADFVEAFKAVQHIMYYHQDFCYPEQMLFRSFLCRVLDKIRNLDRNNDLNTQLTSEVQLALDSGNQFPITQISKSCNAMVLNSFADFVSSHMASERRP